MKRDRINYSYNKSLNTNCKSSIYIVVKLRAQPNSGRIESKA